MYFIFSFPIYMIANICFYQLQKLLGYVLFFSLSRSVMNPISYIVTLKMPLHTLITYIIHINIFGFLFIQFTFQLSLSYNPYLSIYSTH